MPFFQIGYVHFEMASGGNYVSQCVILGIFIAHLVCTSQ